MIWLRQSTASQNIVIGPFLSFTDMKTVQTGLTINNTDIRIHKAGASAFVVKNSGGASHLFGGYYLATLDATDTNTVGRTVIATNLGGVMSWFVNAMVLPADVYDALVENTGRIRSNATHWGGTDVASANVRANVVQVAGQTASAAGAVTFPSAIGTSTLDAATVWSNATRTLTSISDSAGVTTLLSRVTAAVALAGTAPSWYSSPLDAAGVRSAVGLAVGNLDTQLDNLPTVSEFNARSLPSSEYATNSLLTNVAGYIDTEIATLLANVATLLTNLATVDGIVDSILEDTGTTLPASIAAIPTGVGNADALLGRSIAGGANGGRTVRDALRAARNRVAFDVPGPGQFTVFAEDDTTPAWTGTYNAAVGANPVVGVNPD